MLQQAFKLNPNYYAFLSGVMVSASINFYTTIALEDNFIKQHPFVILGSLILFISGTLWAIFSWNLDAINRSALRDSPEFIDEQNVWNSLLSLYRWKLNAYFLGAISTGLLGLILVSCN